MSHTPLDAPHDLGLGEPHDVQVPVRTVPSGPLVDPTERTAPLESVAPCEASERPVTLWPAPAPMFCYLAGAAGSGKSFLAREFAADPKNGAILTATTGIAAVNLSGCTIQAALGYFDTRSLMESYTNGFLTARLGKLWKAGVRRIVIDEVSMLDGDQLTYLVKAIEEVNGRGYVLKSQQWDDSAAEMGLTLVGDFAQLSPVKAPFAFESSEWAQNFPPNTITLTEIRRQADPAFIEALRCARRGDGRGALAYFGPTLQAETDDHFDGPTLMAKNDAVDRYNWIRMNRLQGRQAIFPSTREGKQRSEWGHPDKPPNTWGIPPRLNLKIGALVMVLANKREFIPDLYYDPDEDPAERERRRERLRQRAPFLYVNGDLGELVDADETAHVAYVELQRTGHIQAIDYVHRDVTIPLDSARRKELREKGEDDKISDDGKWEIVGWINYLPLRVAYASTVHKCVSGETRIPIHGVGYQQIAEVRVGNITPYGAVKAVARVEQPAYRIHTERGYSVVASADHRWVTREGLVATGNLTEQSEIKLNGGPPFPGWDSLEIEAWWWLGVTVGDGSYNDRTGGQIHFACMHRQLGDRYAALGVYHWGPPISWRKDRRGLYLTSVSLRKRLASMGLDYVTARYKRVPHTVWLQGPARRAAFLQGLFDADGSCGRNRVVLTTASEHLGEEVQDLLLTLGIVSKRSSFTSGYKGRGDKYWQVWVGAESLDDFKRLVGFWHPEKAAKLLSTKPNRALNPTLTYDRVTGVEPLALTLPMYDIEIEAPHLLTFGPFQGSNSQGLSLDKVQVNIRDAFFKTPSMLYVALSRARTHEGLRLVGTPAAFLERCTVNPQILSWL